MGINDAMESMMQAQGQMARHLREQSVESAKGNGLAQVRGFVAQCQDMVEKVRASLIDADGVYRGKRAEIVNRMQDALDALDRQHEKAIDEHQRLIAKLEEMRR